MDKAQWQRKRLAVAVAAGADGGEKLRPNLWVDDFTLALIKQKDMALKAWGPHLAGFRWQMYVVLTSASRRPTFVRFQWEIQQLLLELQKEYPRLAVYISYDRGKVAGRLNVHLFVGGLFVGKPPKRALHRNLTVTRAIVMVKRLWRHGQVRKIEPYDTRGFAPDYLARQCNNTELVGEFFERLIKKKKQRKRGKWKPKPERVTG